MGFMCNATQQNPQACAVDPIKTHKESLGETETETERQRHRDKQMPRDTAEQTHKGQSVWRGLAPLGFSRKEL